MAATRTDIAFGDNHRGFQLGQNFGQVHIAPGRRVLILSRQSKAC